MIEWQKVEVVRSRIVDLIFCIVTLNAECARELAEVDSKPLAYRKNISTVSPEDVPEDLWPQLICRISPQGLCRLAEHQIETPAEAAPLVYIRRALDYQSGLIEVETVTQHIVSAQE